MSQPTYTHTATILGNTTIKDVANALPSATRVWIGLYKRKPAVFAEYQSTVDFSDEMMKALGRLGLDSLVVRRGFQDKVR